MFVHVLGYIGYVKVGVTIVGELLELGVERFLVGSVMIKTLSAQRMLTRAKLTS